MTTSLAALLCLALALGETPYTVDLTWAKKYLDEAPAAAATPSTARSGLAVVPEAFFPYALAGTPGLAPLRLSFYAGDGAQPARACQGVQIAWLPDAGVEVVGLAAGDPSLAWVRFHRPGVFTVRFRITAGSCRGKSGEASVVVIRLPPGR